MPFGTSYIHMAHFAARNGEELEVVGTKNVLKIVRGVGIQAVNKALSTCAGACSLPTSLQESTPSS